jgi:cobalt/nickel transport system permease protein
VIQEGFSIGHSLIHRLDPRIRLIVAVVFSVVVALSNRFSALILALIFSVVIIFLAGLPLKRVFYRLMAINGFIVLFWIFIPFSFEGEVLFSFGPLTATKEGILYSTMITIKSNSIVIALMSLMTTMPVFTLGRAMRYLYVPRKIVHLFLFTFRYIHTIQREYWRQVNAIKIRGFKPGTNMHTYRTYAYLVGMLLVKSHDRADRVRAAMLCRGFKGRFYDLSEFNIRSTDVFILIIMLLVVTLIGLMQWT